MNFRLRASIIILTSCVFLLFFYNQIRSTSHVVETGEPLLLRLAPVDPRALMQGDYMALGYNRDNFPERGIDAPHAEGLVVFERGDNNIGKFARFDDGSALEDTEIRLSYIRHKRGNISYGGRRYYFQEGTAAAYEQADYGIFAVSPKGRAVLVGLADENAQLIEPPAKISEPTKASEPIQTQD